MKKNKWILPIICCLVLLLTFVGSIFLFKNLNNDLSKVDIQIQKACNELIPDARFEETTENLIKENDDNQILKIYNAYKDNKKIGMVYLVKVRGYQPDFNILVGINAETKKIIDFKIVSYQETYLEDKVFNNNQFLNQFKDADITSETFKFNVAAGATYSSNAIIKAVSLARTSFYKSIGEEVPAPKISITSIKQSFTNVNNFECVAVKNTKTYNLVLEYANNKFTVINGASDLTTDDLAMVSTLAKLPTVYFSSANTEKVVVLSKGYSGYLTIEFTISANKVTNIAVTKNNESYNEPYNQGYNAANGDPINDLPGALVNAGEDFSGVHSIAGATITSNAIKSAYQLVLDYLASKGGN